MALGLLLLLLWPWLLQDVQPDGSFQRYPARQAPEPVNRDLIPQREIVVSPVDSSPERNDNLVSPPALDPMPETAPPVMDLVWPEPARSMVRDADYPAARGTDDDGPSSSFYGRSESPKDGAVTAGTK